MYRGCREQSFKNPRRADPSPALRSTSSSRSVSNLPHVASQRIVNRGATGLKKTSVGETVLSVGGCSDAVAFGGADAGQQRPERAATPPNRNYHEMSSTQCTFTTLPAMLRHRARNNSPLKRSYTNKAGSHHIDGVTTAAGWHSKPDCGTRLLLHDDLRPYRLQHVCHVLRFVGLS